MFGSCADLVRERVMVEGQGQPARGEGQAHQRPAHLAHLVRVRVRARVRVRVRVRVRARVRVRLTLTWIGEPSEHAEDVLHGRRKRVLGR